MAEKNQKYVPALCYDWLTPLYDPVVRLTTRELTFKRHLVQQAQIEQGHRVLDLGCGTATLALLIKQTQPGAEVVGLDGDPKILKIAKSKVDKSGLKVALNCGMAFELPYDNGSFDRVLSTLVLHHLTCVDKEWTFREVLRVLRPGGELHVADWGKPQNTLMRIASLPVRVFDGPETTFENLNGLLPSMIHDAGFEEILNPDQYMTIFGTLSLYKARKPYQPRKPY